MIFGKYCKSLNRHPERIKVDSNETNVSGERKKKLGNEFWWIILVLDDGVNAEVARYADSNEVYDPGVETLSTTESQNGGKPKWCARMDPRKISSSNCGTFVHVVALFFFCLFVFFIPCSSKNINFTNVQYNSPVRRRKRSDELVHQLSGVDVARDKRVRERGRASFH